MSLALSTAFLIVIILAGRLAQGSWRAPGAFFGLIWLIASVPAIAFLPRYVSASTMLLVASFVGAMLAGSQLTLNRDMRAAPPVSAPYSGQPMPRLRALAAAVFVFSLGGIAACVGYVWDAGYSLLELGEPQTWLDMAVHYSAARYHGDYVEPLIVRFFLASNFVGAMVGGVLLAVARTAPVRIVAGLPALSGALITIITTAKSPMLLAGVFLLSGWLAQRASMPPNTAVRISTGRSIAIGVAVILMGAIGTASLALRYGPETTDAALLTERIAGYVFGHMVALSAWLATENWNLLEPTWGTFTFAGLFEFLGLSTRSAGLYEPIGLNEWSAESNVFSALRGAIIDFGLFGAWLVTALAGALSGHAYSRLRAGKGTALSRLGLLVYYAFAAWSPIVSVLSYNVLLLAIVVSAIILLLATRSIEAVSVGVQRCAPSLESP